MSSRSSIPGSFESQSSNGSPLESLGAAQGRIKRSTHVIEWQSFSLSGLHNLRKFLDGATRNLSVQRINHLVHSRQFSALLVELYNSTNIFAQAGSFQLFIFFFSLKHLGPLLHKVLSWHLLRHLSETMRAEMVRKKMVKRAMVGKTKLRAQLQFI